MKKRAVITGASSGIGYETVRLLRKHGWDVVAVARRANRLEALSKRTGADFFRADLTKQQDVDDLAEYIHSSGNLHALVNNAGVAYGLDSVEHSKIEDWQAMFEINVLAPKRIISALLPHLRAGAAEFGHADLLNITSTAAHAVYPGGGGYNASKFALKALTEVLRLELNGEPIRVCEIAPGLVETEEFSLVRFGGDRAKRDAVYKDVPNPLQPADIAATVVSTLELPAHVNLDLVIAKPLAQASNYLLHKGPLKLRNTQ